MNFFAASLRKNQTGNFFSLKQCYYCIARYKLPPPRILLGVKRSESSNIIPKNTNHCIIYFNSIITVISNSLSDILTEIMVDWSLYRNRNSKYLFINSYLKLCGLFQNKQTYFFFRNWKGILKDHL